MDYQKAGKPITGSAAESPGPFSKPEFRSSEYNAWGAPGEGMKHPYRFWIGIILLTTNQPLGWAAMLVCDALAIQRHSMFPVYLGITLYGISWIMLGIGAFLAGPEGVRYARNIFRRLRKAGDRNGPALGNDGAP